MMDDPSATDGPDSRYQSTLTQFSIATNEYRGGQEKAQYHVHTKV